MGTAAEICVGERLPVVDLPLNLHSGVGESHLTLEVICRYFGM
jgi:hypothetical protein